MEEWKDIEGYEGLYQVSNHGRVKSFKYGKEKILKGSITTKGYLQVYLHKDNKIKRFNGHRLIAIHFIPNPDNKPQVNHIDGNKLNNNISNLEWNTQSENLNHAFDTGLKISVKGEHHVLSKLTEEEVLEIRRSDLKRVELAKIYNVHISLIHRIKRNECWKHI
jgi:hypothetical protein